MKGEWPSKLMSLQADIKMYREKIKKQKEVERQGQALKDRQVCWGDISINFCVYREERDAKEL